MSHRHQFNQNQQRPDPMYRPRRVSAGFGGARRRDVLDDADQARAPGHVAGQYDRTGQEGYARGLEHFEADHPPTPRWDLDNGGVEFGREAPRGPYAGRGPRGYQRPDERIREDVCDRLTEASDIDASEIDVRVDAGVVILTGTVDSRAAKRRVEDSAGTVRGVKDVQNQLRVQDRQDRTAASDLNATPTPRNPAK